MNEIPRSKLNSPSFSGEFIVRFNPSLQIGGEANVNFVALDRVQYVNIE